MSKNKKGFTLIELLAVIVILAIIMVIAVPKILDIIESSRKKTAIESGQLYVRAVDQYMTLNNLNQTEYPSFLVDNKSLYTLNDLTSVKVKNKPTSGTVTIETKKVTKADLCINKYRVTYDKKGSTQWNAVKDDSCSGSSDSKDDDKVTLTCDENIYLNGPVSVEDYNKACEDYIDESLYSTSDNADGTVNITGFKDKSTIPTFKDNIMALPTKIDGKTVVAVSDSSFQRTGQETITSKLILSPTITTVGNGSFVSTEVSALAVPYSLETFGSAAFNNCKITKLILTDSVKSIGSAAFYGDPLETLVTGGGYNIEGGMFGNIENTLIDLTIGSDDLSTTQTITQPVFSNYSKLQKVTIKANVKEINSQAFSNDTTLTDVKISNGVEKIGDDAFSNTGIISISLPNSVKLIGSSAFSRTPLTSIALSNNLQSIGDSAFKGDTTIDTFTIPDSVTSLSTQIFDGRTINNLNIGDGVSSFDTNIFTNAKIKKLTIGKDSNKSQTIKEDTFNIIGSNLEEVNIKGSIKSIGESAFKSNSISKLTFSDGITSLGRQSFYGNKLQTVTLPKTLTTIDYDAFGGNSTLKTVNDYSGVYKCDGISSTITLNNKKDNTSKTCTAN